MAAERKPSFMDPVRQRVRRGQLIVGLGFVAYVVGGILASSVMFRLREHVHDVGLIGAALIQNIWLLTTLPGIFYLAARFIDLKPWPTAIGAVVTGELFHVALDYISTGWEWFLHGGVTIAFRCGFIAIGLVFTAYVVRLGRAQAQAGEAEAKQAAEKKKDEYAEFAREAERIANKNEPNAPPPTSPEETKPPPSSSS